MFNKIYVFLKNYIKENKRFLITILVIILLFWVNLPYAIYSPGGLISLEDRIKIDNEYKETGSLNMTYVSMREANIAYLLIGLINPNWEIEKVSDLTMSNESLEDMQIRDHVYLEESIDNAVIAAYTLIGKELTITNENNMIVYISNEADTNLKMKDIIISADNETVTSIEKLREIVSSKEVGEKINLLIKRNDELTEGYITVKMIDGEKMAGISFVTLYDYEANPKVEITSKTSESGPSGGLMLALQIYNRLTEYDLTKGLKIAGTGTISKDGSVGAIGGVNHKILAAIKEEADIFLVPKDNCEEAHETYDKKDTTMKMICVATLSEAIYELS